MPFHWREFLGRRKPEDLEVGRLKKIAQLIDQLDRIRKGHLYPVSTIERGMRDVIDGSELKRIKKEFTMTIGDIRASERMRVIIKVSNTLQWICLEYFTLTLAFIMLRSMNVAAWIIKPLSFLMNPILMLSMMILGVTFYVLHELVKRKLKGLTLNRSARRKGREGQMKEIVQKYVSILRREIISKKLKPHKFRFRLMYGDYEGIRVTSRPGVLSEFYIAEVSI